MVKQCASATRGDLNLIHAFYVGMLALRYRTPRGDKVLWPNQFTWLLEQGLISWEEHASRGMCEDNICDKSNADGVAKLLALAQVSWFVAQSILREIHDLPLSQLETMTLSYIPLVAITYFFWWDKPKDIMNPSLIDLPAMLPAQMVTVESMSVSNNFDDEGLDRQGSLLNIWYLTPRVFEKEARDKAVQEAPTIAKPQQGKETEETQSPTCLDMTEEEQVPNASAEKSVPSPRKEIVLAHWDPDIYRSRFLWPVICLFGASFGALHLISWNTPFPSLVEQWLWRVSALVSIVSMLVFMQFEKVVLRWGGFLTIISLVSPVLYLLSRIAMIGGVIAAFRGSDPAVYETYVVSTYWVHIL